MYKLFVCGLVLVYGLAPDVHGWCLWNSWCASDEVCNYFAGGILSSCVNVCGITCGAQTECVTHSHKAICTCKEGFSGNPQKGCHFLKETCENNCGPKTNCSVYDDRAFCGCQQGFAGNPFDKNQGCVQAPDVVDAAKCWSEDREEEPSLECLNYFKQRREKQFTIMLGNQVSWFEAHKLCEVENKMLAIIENRRDQETLEEKLISEDIRDKLWLAGSDIKMNGRFQWVAGRTFNKMKFTNWDSKEPTGNKRHCLVMDNRFNWVSEDCTNRNAFVCMDK